ncbi:hypothetical protein BU15DRAFT_47651 [Melanogaster broomeanus]|nr:hypothetical protein BU15DRAFT_47651 [Melanogaster broomeanus]
MYPLNTSLAVGRSNHTTNRLMRDNSACGSSSQTSRNRRYSVAEQALAKALKNSSEERSPHELQIWALQQASVALGARAQESRECASKLKLSLAERNTDPHRYVALQRERWMEEKRQLAVCREADMLTQHLVRLKADPGGQDLGEHENRGLPATLNNEARRRAINLTRFFDHSPTRTSFHLNLKCRPALEWSPPRRITMSDVSPLRLRPSSTTPPLQRLTTKRLRSASMASGPFSPMQRSCRPRPSNSPSDASSLAKGAELIESFDEIASTRPSTPPLSVASQDSSSSHGVIEENKGTGTATIISHFTPRSRAEILADLDQDDVHVPDYAINLLGGFDRIHDKFSLPDRDLFVHRMRGVKPMEVTPPPESANAPRPSEESDTGPYTSFALPPFAVQPSWSHISLNSPSSPSTPRMHPPTLQPLTPSSASPFHSSTPSTPRASKSSKSTLARRSLLFTIRKRKAGSGDDSPASSSTHMQSVQESIPAKKRFSFFSSRK